MHDPLCNPLCRVWRRFTRRKEWRTVLCQRDSSHPGTRDSLCFTLVQIRVLSIASFINADTKACVTCYRLLAADSRSSPWWPFSAYTRPTAPAAALACSERNQPGDGLIYLTHRVCSTAISAERDVERGILLHTSRPRRATEIRARPWQADVRQKRMHRDLSWVRTYL